MFNQQEYINNYIKNKYREIKIRIRNDDVLLMNKLEDITNFNAYITNLIREDIYKNRVYHFINNNVQIDFELSPKMENLIKSAETADIINDYGSYINYVDAIDAQAKKETSYHLLKESQWKKLLERYSL